MALGVSWKDPAKELAKICKKWTQEKLKCAVTGELASYVLAPILLKSAPTKSISMQGLLPN
ncbi:MAG TPA: hypothetical protein DCY86_08060 [Bdellovibrionales bacterium]|nr:hypothetical protein [Bdellovibrionales bacterium]